MKLLVTGATGMVARALVGSLAELNFIVRAAFRNQSCNLSANVFPIPVGDIGPETDWQRALADIDVVIHTAARVHLMNDEAKNPLAEFRHVNVHGTLNLARQAAKVGIHRLIFLSSIKVNGEVSLPGQPFTEKVEPNPADPYAISKYEAEQGLLKLAEETGMEVVIIRPTLVYGPGVKANFLNLLRLLHRRIPLPLGAINNKRTLLALGNLVDLIITCIEHPAAANQIFLAGDGEDLSTTDLLLRLGKALGKPACLLPAPPRLLEVSALLLGKKDIAQRLLCSLQVDITKAKTILGWSPPISVDEGLRRTSCYFLNSRAL